MNQGTESAMAVRGRALAGGGGAGGVSTHDSSPVSVWLSAGSALAAMVALSWYVVLRGGGVAPGGDMVGTPRVRSGCAHCAGGTGAAGLIGFMAAGDGRELSARASADALQSRCPRADDVGSGWAAGAAAVGRAAARSRCGLRSARTARSRCWGARLGGRVGEYALGVVGLSFPEHVLRIMARNACSR